MDDNYFWTQHSLMKMKHYGLSQQRVKRVVRNPERVEEGIVEKTIASMQRAGSEKHPYEIWVMYQVKLKVQSAKLKVTNKNAKLDKFKSGFNQKSPIKVISAWRYPGISPKNNPIPEEILREIRKVNF